MSLGDLGELLPFGFVTLGKSLALVSLALPTQQSGPEAIVLSGL